ncbi:hypothetical protein VIRA109638_16290 [Vibrio rarus]
MFIFGFIFNLFIIISAIYICIKLSSINSNVKILRKELVVTEEEGKQVVHKYEESLKTDWF